MSAVIISQGDAAGIGFDCLLKILRNPATHSVSAADIRRLIVVGDFTPTFRSRIEELFTVREFRADGEIPADGPVFLRLKESDIHPGRPDPFSGERSHAAFASAMLLWRQLPGSALLTLPVSKEMIIRSGRRFSGHTEEIAAFCRRNVFMCMTHEKQSVIPLTTHVPLVKTFRHLKKVNWKSLEEAIAQYRMILGSGRDVAFLGLNPHAGENGKIGTEENYLRRRLDQLSKKLPVKGLFAADSFFQSGNIDRYELVLACYHDQGLIPFKTLFGLEGINVTLNLPQLRVSPDHGPAYDLAASGGGDGKSILYSLRFSLQWGSQWKLL